MAENPLLTGSVRIALFRLTALGPIVRDDKHFHTERSPSHVSP
jgi:hypothetical protein